LPQISAKQCSESVKLFIKPIPCAIYFSLELKGDLCLKRECTYFSNSLLLL